MGKKINHLKQLKETTSPISVLNNEYNPAYSKAYIETTKRNYKILEVFVFWCSRIANYQVS